MKHDGPRVQPTLDPRCVGLWLRAKDYHGIGQSLDRMRIQFPKFHFSWAVSDVTFYGNHPMELTGRPGEHVVNIGYFVLDDVRDAPTLTRLASDLIIRPLDEKHDADKADEWDATRHIEGSPYRYIPVAWSDSEVVFENLYGEIRSIPFSEAASFLHNMFHRDMMLSMQDNVRDDAATTLLWEAKSNVRTPSLDAVGRELAWGTSQRLWSMLNECREFVDTQEHSESAAARLIQQLTREFFSEIVQPYAGPVTPEHLKHRGIHPAADPAAAAVMVSAEERFLRHNIPDGGELGDVLTSYVRALEFQLRSLAKTMHAALLMAPPHYIGRHGKRLDEMAPEAARQRERKRLAQLGGFHLPERVFDDVLSFLRTRQPDQLMRQTTIFLCTFVLLVASWELVPLANPQAAYGVLQPLRQLQMRRNAIVHGQTLHDWDALNQAREQSLNLFNQLSQMAQDVGDAKSKEETRS